MPAVGEISGWIQGALGGSLGGGDAYETRFEQGERRAKHRRKDAWPASSGYGPMQVKAVPNTLAPPFIGGLPLGPANSAVRSPIDIHAPGTAGPGMRSQRALYPGIIGVVKSR